MSRRTIRIESFDQVVKMFRNAAFDAQVVELWRQGLQRKVEMVLSYPFKEKELLRQEANQCIEVYLAMRFCLISQAVVGENPLRDLDFLFPQLCSKVFHLKCNYDYSEFLHRMDSDRVKKVISFYHSVEERISCRHRKFYRTIPRELILSHRNQRSHRICNRVCLLHDTIELRR